MSAPAEPGFVRLQRAFARHLRDPEHVEPPPGHEPRRLAIYRHAIFANVATLMADNYPRVRAVLSEQQWNAMMRAYIIGHQSRASAFVNVPEEFLAYLEQQRAAADDPPFLAELAHFDWIETLIGADPRRLDFSDVDRGGDLLNGVPVANPVLRMFSYRYPVHAINADYQPQQAPARSTCIAAFRDADHLYGFLDLNVAAARLLEIIMHNSTLSGHEIFEQIADEMAHADVAALCRAGTTILARMHFRGAVLGTRRAAAV